MDILDAQRKVLEWASTADSFDKLGFFKSFIEDFGLREVHHAKNMLANVRQRPENRKREWIGEEPEEKKRKLRRIENQDLLRENEEVPSLPRSLVPRCEGAWWGELKEDGLSWKDSAKGFDAEHVHLRSLSGSARIRAGIVGVVDANYHTLYHKKVFHEEGSFLDQFWINGIQQDGLVRGVPMRLVTKRLKELLQDSLVIVCGGMYDFSCADLPKSKFVHFDLQDFYKRRTINGNLTGMSLRDIFFLEFQEDFQGSRTHSAESDARATVKIFIEGYCKRMKTHARKWDKSFFQEFNDAISLKNKQKEGLLYCNTEKKFKRSKCRCTSCQKLFY